jgi:hypothetical protein
MVTILPTATHGDMFSVLQQMDVGHPTFPHWYLPWFGVDAAQQEKEARRPVAEACLTVVDTSHLPDASAVAVDVTSKPLLLAEPAAGTVGVATSNFVLIDATIRT